MTTVETMHAETRYHHRWGAVGLARHPLRQEDYTARETYEAHLDAVYSAAHALAVGGARFDPLELVADLRGHLDAMESALDPERAAEDRRRAVALLEQAPTAQARAVQERASERLRHALRPDRVSM